MGKKSKCKTSKTPKEGNGLSKTGIIISNDGHMLGKESKWFYNILIFLSDIAMPKLENLLKKDLKKSRNLPWLLGNFIINSSYSKQQVLSFILAPINSLIDEINNKVHDLLFVNVFN